MIVLLAWVTYTISSQTPPSEIVFVAQNLMCRSSLGFQVWLLCRVLLVRVANNTFNIANQVLANSRVLKLHGRKST